MITSAIDSLIKINNPLTPDEIERLKTYREKIAQGATGFSKEEAIDFQKLVHKAQKEHPDNAGLYILLGLAVLISGLALSGGSNKE